MQTDLPQMDRRILLQNALTAVEKLQAKLDAMEQAQSEPIAIIGLGCRFPGGANTPEAYWELLQAGRDVVTEVPAERWNMADYTDPQPDGMEQTVNWFGGFLDQVDQFDPQFFGISPREAETMDPQQRLVLEVSWEALERAGQPPDKLKGSQTGIFIGITTNDYSQLAKLGGPAQMDVYTATGTALNAAPGRVAYTLGLHGPSVAVDTACSSSLVAVHLACQSLRTGESNLALAGGVNALLAPEAFICFSKWGMMAPDGRCKTFDARANGFVRGEGCGIIVLKRLSDALAAGDNILALIRGSAVNQDGRSSGLTVPNGLAQQAVIRKALANAKVQPNEISYVEAHGTGTSLGDPIEIEALGAVLGEGRSNEQPLAIGSVKTNIGHLESASGIAGLIKIVLSMQHQELPPHLHLQERSPQIPWPKFPVIIPTERQLWSSGNGPRLAGVSSFGFSGTNAHIILEEASEQGQVLPQAERPYHLLSLSAKNELALKQLAAQFANHLAAHPAEAVSDVAYTVNSGRANFSHRLAVVAESAQEASEKLATWSAGQKPAGVVSGQISGTGRPQVVFLFTGQGAQYSSMGRQLYETQPTFRKILDRCDELLRPYLEQSLLAVLYPKEGAASPIDETMYTQPALFALEYALAMLWRAWGIEPAAVIGHSVGEYVAACVAGVFSLEDGLKLIAARGQLMQALPQGGEMAAVFADEARVATAIASYTDQVSIAAVNGPENVVISGAGTAIQAILETLAAEGIKAQRLIVSHAFHSPLMEPMLDAFAATAATITYRTPQIKVISNVTGQAAGQEIATAAYWREHVGAPVRFAAGMQTLHAQGYQWFLEIGPKPTLLSLGQRCLPGGGKLWLPSLRSGRADWPQMLESLATLYANGQEVNWAGFEQDYAHRKLSLPTYPFQRQRYWLEVQPVDTQIKRSGLQESQNHPLLGTRVDLAFAPDTYVWQGELDLNRLRYLADHRVQGVAVLPATAYMEMAMSAVVEIFGAGVLTLTETENKKVLVLSEAAPPPRVQVVLSKNSDGSIAFQVFSQPQHPGQVHKPNEPWTLHVTGKLRHQPGVPAGAMVKPFDPEEIKSRCPEEIAGEVFYQRLSEKGNQWGPCFQGIERVWRGRDEALSLVRVPPALEGEVNRYQFHPAVSDASGHVLTATISLDKSDESKGGAFVGGGVDEARLYRHPQGLYLWAYARLRPRENQADNILIGDVQLMDETGQLVSETIGARLWYLDLEEQQHLQQNLDDWFYELQWQVSNRQASEPTKTENNWLVLADRTGTGEALGVSLKAQGEQYVLVSPGDRFEQVGERHFTVRPDQPGDLHRLLAESGLAKNTGVCQIVHLWSLEAGASEPASLAWLETAQQLGSTVTLHLIQALAQVKWSRPPKLWLVTQGAQAVGEDNLPVAVAQATLWGFGRALMTEISEFWGGLIDLDPAMGAPSAAAQLLAEISDPNGEDQLAFRRGQRYIARLVRQRSLSAGAPLHLHTDGTYLITGGLGGLGLEVARWLVANGARWLILFGRTKLPVRSEWSQIDPESRQGRKIVAIQGLEAAGATISLAAVDVADEAQLQSLLEQLKAEDWPPVRGVVHAAGIMQYQSMLEHTAAEMETILRPKVKGGWLLHRLLKDAPLDFFVLFSSASAVLSSPLIGSYAAANAFLDGLAHYRRAQGLPALSINWGLWSEVGMGADFDKGERNQSPGGMGLIAPRQGLAALERLLSQNLAQVAVMPVNWAQWQKFYPAFSKSRLLSQLVQPEVDDPSSTSRGFRLTVETLLAIAPDERLEVVTNYLVEQVAHILKLPTTILDVYEPLTNLGFDSLMALELKNRIEADLEVVMPMVQFLQGPSTTQLAGLILEKVALGETTAAPPPSPANGNPAGSLSDQGEAMQLLASLDQLSEEQMDLLLSNLLTEEGIDE